MNKKQLIEKKVVLAFSGGLDTTFCVKHFQEKGYKVVTATINTGGFSEEKLKDIEMKAKSLGTIKHHSIEVQEEMFEKIISKQIQMNALFEDEYPLMCADRYIISEKLLEIAKLENTDVVAHGSTANGNDQVRFNSSLISLNPKITILEPIKNLNITRDEEIKYLESKGIKVDKTVKKYSINENIFGNTVSGSEIDLDKEPSNSAYQLTKCKLKSFDQQEYIKIEYNSGIPVALNGEKMSGLNILKFLNEKIGQYAWGSSIYTGDCIIGIKGHLMFEAPGILALIKAHKKLEQYTLTKEQLYFSKKVGTKWADLVYSGLYYEPLVKNLEIFSADLQKKVTGVATIKLEHNKLEVVEIQSINSLVNKDIATYAQKGSWTIDEVNGFIKLYSLQQKISIINHDE